MVKALEEGKISRTEMVVALITVNVLKDVESAKRSGGEVLVINPNLKAVKEAMK